VKTHHNQLPLDLLHPLQRIIPPFPQCPRMNVGREITYRSPNSLIHGATKRQMPPQTHASCTDAAVASRVARQAVNGQRGVLVVRCELLRGLPYVALVCARTIVGEGSGGGEFVVAGGGGDDVAMAGDLAGKTGYRTGDWRWEGA